MARVAKFKLNAKGIRRLIKLNGGSQHAWRTCLKLMAKRYSGYIIRRYKAEGFGTWKDLEPSTIARRRKKKGGGGRPRILIDEGTMLNSLTIGNQRNHHLVGKLSVQYGFGNVAHPDAKGMTVRELAVAHQEGRGRLPARPILVEPSDTVKRVMMQFVKQAERRMLRKAQQVGGR